MKATMFVKRCVAAGVSLIALGVLFASAPSASAQTMGYFKIVSRSSGKVLDVPNSSTLNNAIIQQVQDNGGANQQWALIPAGNGFYKIMNRNSAKVLERFVPPVYAPGEVMAGHV